MLLFLASCESPSSFAGGHPYSYQDFEHIRDWGTFNAIDAAEDGLYFIYFYGATCPACVSIKQDILAFAAHNAGDHGVYLIDVSAGVAGTPPFPIGGGVPQLHAIRDGEQLETVVGSFGILDVIASVEAGGYAP